MTTAAELVQAIRSSLPASHEWTERDAALLDLAERQARDIDRLEADIEQSGVRVPGRGAEVLNQAFCEVRQARVEQRREFLEALLEADSFDDLAGKWQAAIHNAEENRPDLRIVDVASARG